VPITDALWVETDAPWPRNQLKIGVPLEDFSLDGVGLVLKCPNGVALVSTSAASAKLQARFDLAICKGCQNKDQCPVRPVSIHANTGGKPEATALRRQRWIPRDLSVEGGE